jgi:hypothetical protein
MNGLLDRCIVCGLPATKPGNGICIRHEIEALIALSYERMVERLRRKRPQRVKIFPTAKRDFEKL